MRRIPLAVMGAVFLCGGAQAQMYQEPGPFYAFMAADAAECIPLSAIEKKVKATARPLTTAQFQFVRALYVAIPPLSHEFPRGDRAAAIEAGGKTMLVLLTGEGDAEQTCARFMAPDFILNMLDHIDPGEAPQAGDPT